MSEFAFLSTLGTHRPHRPLVVNLYITVITLGTLYFMFTFTLETTGQDGRVNAKVTAAFGEWRECIIDHLSIVGNDAKSTWSEMESISATCDKTIAAVNMTELENSDEVKYHVMPREPVAGHIVSLGVGHDTRVETALQERLPIGTRFYGADPIIEINQEMYEKIGPFYPVAVGGECGVSEADVLIGDSYTKRPMLHIDIITFMTKFVRQSFYDAIIIDAEHAEYGMFPFFSRGGEFERNDITICQFNMEIHDPDSRKLEKTRDFFHRMLRDHRYSWHRVENVGHLRVFFINHENPTCVNRYLAQFF